ncbi:NADPH-dependent FMN reductase [Pararhodobacter sp.]|uniref:NADPH-dependent FMN reductase n=1 Tax=Pararhodobacter sp. TaxID=2127056 RepID=UPI002AFF90FB|nr:NADPH-dependent FMN reductase [Pararhodobacter sp.]
MSGPRLLGLCGSLRAESLNRKLMLEAARAFDGDFAEASLRLPLFDEDLEAQGIPAEVAALGAAVAGAQAVLFACPEYNKAPPGAVKNALDWLSRLKPNPLRGKPVAIVTAADGRAGGERSQMILRWMLVPHRVEPLAWPEVLVARAETEFDAEGRLTSERYRAQLAELMGRLRDACR